MALTEENHVPPESGSLSFPNAKRNAKLLDPKLLALIEIAFTPADK